MKRLTLHNIKLCKLVMLSPILLSCVLCLLVSILTQNPGEILISIFSAGIFILWYFSSYFTCFTMLSTIDYCSKRNFEVKAGKKTVKQELYQKWYDMTLWDFIKDFEGFTGGYGIELKQIANSLQDGCFLLKTDALYYREDGKIFEVCIEFDNEKPKHIYVDTDLSFWAYPNSTLETTKSERQSLRVKIGNYLHEQGYAYEYKAL